MSQVKLTSKRKSDNAGAAAGGPASKISRPDPLMLMSADRLEGQSLEPSILTPREHAGVPAVLLFPRIKVEDDKIARVIMSRLQRTPSPFGNKMGDHTVAWQAVVDQLHARLHGLSVAEAVTELRERQKTISAWMSDPGSEGYALLRQLEDEVTRGPLLENAAYQVNTLLSDAETGSADDQRRGLEQAIAWHLTYVNYLPFATVPARSSRGSHGSGEGRHRAVLVDEELKGMDAADDLSGVDRGALNDALWRMFAFDAALREAGAEMAVVPASVDATIAKSQELTGLAERCLLYINKTLSEGPSTKPRIPYEWLDTPKPDILKGVELEDLPDEVAECLKKPDFTSSGQYPELTELGGHITDSAKYLSGLFPGKQSISVLRDVARYRDDIEQDVIAVKHLSANITEQSKKATPNAALVLAHLLRDHQETVARAYPRSVTVSEFLTPSPAEAATKALGDAIRKEYRDRKDERVEALTDEVKEHLLSRSDPVAAKANDWAKGATTEELVVTYWPNRPLTVSGRAPAPPGVAGMGSHTTAWIVETMATEALVSGALRAGRDPVAAIQAEVARDLTEGPIELDCLLPADQLQAEQLQHVFEHALQVFKETTIEDAVTAFLKFRNMLPYATVNEGGRGGHGENARAGKGTVLDVDALQQAADTQADALRDDQRRDASSHALRETADRLAQQANLWATQDEVRLAVEASIKRLRDQADRQDRGIPNRQSIIDPIFKIRKGEHRRTYENSKTSSFALE